MVRFARPLILASRTTTIDVRLIRPDGVEHRTQEELPALLEKSDTLVWVDVPSCDADAVALLRTVFGFHPRAIKDCRERTPLPKLHVYLGRLAVIAAVTLPVTAVSSILGMNVITSDHTGWGPLVVLLVLMAAMSGVLLVWARRQGWWRPTLDVSRAPSGWRDGSAGRPATGRPRRPRRQGPRPAWSPT